MLLKFLILFYLSINSFLLYAANPRISLKSILDSYKDGDYVSAIEQLEKAPAFMMDESLRNYWIGVCYKGMQDYEMTAQYLEKAESGIEKLPKDLYFVLGQAYFSLDKLRFARQAFQKSLQIEYKPLVSRYYLAYMDQLEKNYGQALRGYENLISQNNVPKDLLQSAHFQMAELMAVMSDGLIDPVPNIRNKALPQFELAKNLDEASVLGRDIVRRIQEVKDKYDLDETKMRNGRKVSNYAFEGSVTEELGYDTNVMNEADQAPAQSKAIRKGSSMSRTYANLSRLWTFDRAFRIEPRLNFTFVHHFERDVPRILNQDRYLIDTSVQSGVEHSLFGKMGHTLVEILFNYTAKDVNATKTRQFYGRSYTYSLIEKISFFKVGETTFSIRFKDFTSYLLASDSTTKTLNILQLFQWGASQNSILTLNADMNRLPNNPSSDSNLYFIRGDHTFLKLWSDLDLGLAFTILLTDTMNQKATRGNEVQLAPSFDISTNIHPGGKIKLKYEYIDQNSKDKSAYAYTKSTYFLSYRASF